MESKFYFSYCDTPIKYRIDTVDPRFKLSKDEFLTDIQQATKIWDDAEGKNLFEYDPNGDKDDLSVSLIYDERQSLDNQINDIQSQLQNQKSDLTPKMQQYQQESADFNNKLAQFEQQVNYWNSQGGAPPDQYDKLKQQQADLQAEADRLNQEAKDLNLSADQYNAKVSELNQTVDSFNAELAQKPEEGLFDGKSYTISIYFDNNHAELIHTLAHEFGHSLGMDHNSDKKSIMYPYSSQSITPSPEDLTALNVVCQQHSVFEALQQRINVLLQHQNEQVLVTTPR